MGDGVVIAGQDVWDAAVFVQERGQIGVDASGESEDAWVLLTE